MITIHKYTIGTDVYNSGVFEQEMPEGAALRHFDIVDGELRVWAEIDTDRVMSKKLLQIIGTGKEVPVSARHFMSVVTPAQYVWHLYEILI